MALNTQAPTYQASVRCIDNSYLKAKMQQKHEEGFNILEMPIIEKPGVYGDQLQTSLKKMTKGFHLAGERRTNPVNMP